MTVGRLKELLNSFDDDLEVAVLDNENALFDILIVGETCFHDADGDSDPYVEICLGGTF